MSPPPPPADSPSQVQATPKTSSVSVESLSEGKHLSKDKSNGSIHEILASTNEVFPTKTSNSNNQTYIHYFKD